MKVCKQCFELKDWDDFSLDKKSADHMDYRCKKCNNERAKKASFKKRYGISLDDKKKMIEKQNNKCLICKKTFSFDTKCIHTDHDHKKNKVRGILCKNCNQLLGWYEKNKDVIEEYLK